jgi:hypothetical protein
MKHEDCRWDLTAFPEHRHRESQGLDRHFKDEGSFLRHQPPRVVFKKAPCHTVLRSAHPHGSKDGTQQSPHQDRNQTGQASCRHRDRPIEAGGCNAGQAGSDRCRYYHPKRAATK